MKIADERPYQSHIFQELPSNGNSKLDFETERQSKHNFLADKMVEQTNRSEHSFVKGEHQNGGKTGQKCVEDYSYDKDVVEIKLPDTVLSSEYGSHFVKDVCIDEGVLPDKKTSAEKLVDQKVSINFDSSEDTNSNLGEDIRADNTKTAPELKSQIVILPVMCGTDGNTAEQNSLCKDRDLGGNNTAAIYTDPNDEKSNPKHSHEGAQGGQQVGSVSSNSNENLETFFNGEAAHQVSLNGCHETGVGIASETSNTIHSDLPAESAAADFSVAIPKVVDTALDKGESNQVNHYNPFIAYGSLDETWEPNYSLPTIVDAASIAPICPVEKTDSFSDLVNRAPEGFDPIEIDEAIIEDNRSDSVEASSSILDVQASEQCNDKRESLTDDMKTDVAHETGISTSLTTSNREPSDVKKETGKKCDDGAQDTNDFNPRDVEAGTTRSEGNTDSKSSPPVQTESVVQQNGPDSAKVTAQTVIRNPFESSFSGPSITSGPLTPSGHIPYSGNISLRSESSTTSTRSFAFPVLQNEWNSSPVKMAKADRRRLREDRGWGYRILCCKF